MKVYCNELIALYIISQDYLLESGVLKEGPATFYMCSEILIICLDIMKMEVSRQVTLTGVGVDPFLGPGKYLLIIHCSVDI